MDTSIVAMRHNDTTIAFDTSKRVWNLTDLWRAAGSPENREPWNWARKEGKRYLEVLKQNLPHSQVLEVGSDHFKENLCDTQVLETLQGRNGGTWAHELAGLEYARYLSPELSIACNQFILNSHRQPQQVTPAAQIAALEQRIAALEQRRHQPEPETITITLSLVAHQRLGVMRDLGGIVTPAQLAEELRQRGFPGDYLNILSWLNRAAKRGLLHKRYRGEYEVKDDTKE